MDHGLRDERGEGLNWEGWLEVPPASWDTQFVLLGGGVGALFFIFGVSVEMFAFLSGIHRASEAMRFAPHILGLMFAGVGLLALCSVLHRQLRRTAFLVDEELLHRKDRWLFLKRTRTWPRGSICEVTLERSRIQAASHTTGIDGKATMTSTDWQDLILRLNDEKTVSLAEPSDAELLAPIHQALVQKLSRGSEVATRSWGMAPSGEAMSVEDRPGWLKITLCPVSPLTQGSSYWAGVLMMALPFLFGMGFVVPGLLGYTNFFKQMFPSREFLILGIMIFTGAGIFIFGLGGFIYEWVRKSAKTQWTIVCDRDQLTVTSELGAKVTTRRFKARDIAYIRREKVYHDGTRFASETIDVVTEAGAARVTPDEGEYVCRRCGYDLRHEPEMCPECGAKPDPREPAEAMPGAEIGCRSAQEAEWVTQRLKRWLGEYKAVETAEKEVAGN